MATYPIIPPPEVNNVFADQYVRRLEPWLTQDLETLSRAIASMFDQVLLYSADTDDDEGWTTLFNPDLCPVEALPYLAQIVGETLPVGIEEAAAREWIKDNPITRRGTPEAVFQAAQRRLTGGRMVSMIERYQGVVDVVAIRTNTSQTPDPAGTRQDILDLLPADVVLDYLVVAGKTWDDTKPSTWNTTKTKTWSETASGLTGWSQYQRPAS